MKTAIIVGIRSHFVKLAGLLPALGREATSATWPYLIVRAGQHYDWELAQQYVTEYSLPVDVDFTGSVAEDPRPHFVLGRMLAELEDWLHSRSDIGMVAVFGDANASLAGAIAGRRAGKRVAHIEAGLRTRDEVNPEELNRRLIDHAAQLHLASCAKDLGNLVAEGFSTSAFLTGDVVKDLVYSRSVYSPAAGRDVFICIHRKENIGDLALIETCIRALHGQGLRPIVLGHPAGMRGLEQVCRPLGVELHGSIGHGETLALIEQCRFGITDSGALQREAYYLDRRLLIRQDHPFWSSLIDMAFHRKIAREAGELEAGIRWALAQPPVPREQLTEFGDGRAGPRIVEHLGQLAGRGGEMQ